MKYILILFFSLTFLLTQAQSEVVGKWITVDDKAGARKSVVEIYESEGRYYGKVIKLIYKPPHTLCERCEGELKNQPIVGMDIIREMKYHKNSKSLEGGIILNPESGKVYSCKIWAKKDVLMVRGYLFFFYRTQEWLPYKGEDDGI